MILQVQFVYQKIYIHSSASLIHEEIFRKLIVKISNYLNNNPVGKVIGSRFPLRLADGKRVEPDLMVLSNSAISNGKLEETFYEVDISKEIQVINTLGRIVTETVLDSQNRVDVSNLNSGMYFVRIQDLSGNSTIKKIMIK